MYKVAGSSESGSYAFSFSQSDKHVGAVTTLRNTDTSTPIDASAVNSGSSVDITAPSVTPSANGVGQLVFAGRDSGDSNGGSVFSFPAPLNEEWERKTGTGSSDHSVGTGLRIIIGGSGVPTGGVTVANETGFGPVAWGAITTTIKPSGAAQARNQAVYGYLGAKQRNTTLPTGAIEMGARIYAPHLGRFLQTDPIYGGSANNYDYTNQDPINDIDLSGLAAGACAVPRSSACRSYGAAQVGRSQPRADKGLMLQTALMVVPGGLVIRGGFAVARGVQVYRSRHVIVGVHRTQAGARGIALHRADKSIPQMHWKTYRVRPNGKHRHVSHRSLRGRNLDR